MEENNNDIKNTAEQKKVNPEKVKYSIRLALLAFSITLLIGLGVLGISYLAGGNIGSADTFCEKGEKAFEAGNYEKAEKYLLLALERDSSHQDARIALCDTYEMEEKYQEEYDTANEGVTLSPATFEYYSHVIKSLCYMGKMSDARAFMAQCENSYVLMKIEHSKPDDIGFSVEPGVYGEEFDLVLTSSSGSIIYYTTDGSEPTLKSAMYSSPIHVSDRSTIRAFAISESGIITDEALGSFRVRDENATYQFKDSAVESIVRGIINNYGDITYKDLDAITTFTSEGSSSTISTLDDFAEFLNVTSVTIKGDDVTDYSGLSAITKLKTLKLWNVTLTEDNMEQIGSCIGVTNLTIDGCQVTDVSALATLTGLTTLNLDNNSVAPATFAPLKSLKINEMSIKNNGLTSLGSIGEIATLRKLDISSNSITSLEGISHLTNLTTLIANDNEISSTPGMSFLTSLKEVNLSNNSLTDVSELANAKSMSSLDISGNRIEDFSPLRSANLASLTAKSCGISSLSSICDIITLRSLDVSDNSISDVSPLASLAYLTELKICNNSLKTIQPLRGMSSLTSVDIAGNDVPQSEAVLFSTLKINWG